MRIRGPGLLRRAERAGVPGASKGPKGPSKKGELAKLSAEVSRDGRKGKWREGRKEGADST